MIAVGHFEYSAGDFAYVRPNDEKLQPHVMRIERIWREDDEAAELVSGTWFYRPHETYHLATRKFLEKVHRDEQSSRSIGRFARQRHWQVTV